MRCILLSILTPYNIDAANSIHFIISCVAFAENRFKLEPGHHDEGRESLTGSDLNGDIVRLKT